MRVGGYLVITAPDAPVIERDTVQCRHCQRILEVKPGTWGQVYLIPDRRQPSGYREEAGAFCRQCMGPLCLPCEARGDCVPWERQLEQMERRR